MQTKCKLMSGKAYELAIENDELPEDKDKLKEFEKKLNDD